MSLDFGPTQTLGFAVLVLYIGIFLIARLRFLSDNNIPVPEQVKSSLSYSVKPDAEKTQHIISEM